MGKKSLDEIWEGIVKQRIDQKLANSINEELSNIRPFVKNRHFGIGGGKIGLPNDFIVISSVKRDGVDSPYITYKNIYNNTYENLDLSKYVSGVAINNTNEIVRFGKNDLFISGNWNSPDRIVISLLNCRLIGGKLIPGKVLWRLVPELTYGVHGVDYDKINGFIYMCNFSNYSDGFVVGRIDPRNLEIYETYKFPNSGQFRFGPTDVICKNGYAYMLFGTNGGNVVRFGSGDLVPTILYSLSSPLTYAIYYDTPFAIDDQKNELYYTTIYATGTITQRRNTIGIVVIDLDTGILKRRLNLQSIGSSGTNFPYAHWMEFYKGKIYVTMVGSSGNRQLLRFDSETLILEEVYQNDTGVSDDNLIVGDYLYLCQEDSVGLVTPPVFLKINLYNFNDRVVEIENLNDGFGSYGAVRDVWS